VAEEQHIRRSHRRTGDMTTTTLTRGVRQRRDVSRLLPVGLLVGFVAIAVALRGVGGFPDNWNINLADPIDEFQRWIRDNQRTHPVFQYFFQPISDAVDWSLDTLATRLQELPWFALPLVVLTLIGRTGQWATAILAATAIALPGMFGLWEPTMETLALMLVAVAISVVIGVPLGVAAGLNRGFYAFLRPVLDAMQTVPSTAYLTRWRRWCVSPPSGSATSRRRPSRRVTCSARRGGSCCSRCSSRKRCHRS
jgi:glycine betaine/proline transport system permease protein